MKISLNGEPREVTATRLSDVLAELGLAEAKVATAVNGEFVPVIGRERMELAEGDRLEIVAPQQGG
jgi:sulfur carrier protein